ncbi:hypothetical protein TeGR_g13909, partial [Tetraparma gracilis]
PPPPPLSYKNEIAELVSSKMLTKANVCFSRDGGEPGLKYVQHLMARPDDANTIRRLMLAEDGMFFICGDGTRMAKDVTSALEDILGDGDKERGAKLVETLKSKGKILVDVWSG